MAPPSQLFPLNEEHPGNRDEHKTNEGKYASSPVDSDFFIDLNDKQGENGAQRKSKHAI